MLLLFFVANVDALCPLTIMHVLKPVNYTHEVLFKKKQHSWRIVFGCTSWVNLDLYLCMLNVPGSWELICTQPEQCWIKYRNISCCSTTISISTIMIGFSAVAALIVFEKAVTSVSTILKWATSMLVSNLYLQLHIGTQ